MTEETDETRSTPLRAFGAFAPAAKQAVYDVIALRRDIRNFRPDAVPAPVLRRILEAAHRAGSVGLMQPWDFILVRSAKRKGEIYQLFRQATARAEARYHDNRRVTYGALKLQGILDAPICICVTCDTTRGGAHVLGRDSIPEMDRYSTCLAVQNLWLAARAEGVGVGWMSIVDNTELAKALELPSHVVPIAFLCLGYPVEFPAAPMLETTGWSQRLPLDALIHEDRWNSSQTIADGEPTSPMLDHAVSSNHSRESNRERWLDSLRSRVTRADPDGTRGARVRSRLDRLAMPRGSMGRVADLAVRLAIAQECDIPTAEHPRVVVFAGDHGVTAQGVSAYKPEVTARLCYNMLAGGAVVSALLRAQHHAPLEIVDVGVDHAFGPHARLRAAKLRRGTRDLATGPALTRAEALAAIEVGASVVLDGLELDVLALGEVGIGNTTAAAALLALLIDASAEEVVGAGTGVGDRARARKVEVVERALARARERGGDAIDQLAEVGGLEIAALSGAMLAAAARRTPVLLDGFITGVAALLAERLAPPVVDYLIASHRSAERAGGLVLERLRLTPLLELDLRLGEASGAVLALPLVRAARALVSDVRTFEEVGIDPPLDERGTK